MRGPTTRVIKNGTSAPSTPSPEEALCGARDRAQEILSDALVEAARLREGVEADLQRIRLTASQEGYAEGMARAAAGLARVAAVRDAALSEVDQAVVDVALEIARQIVGREIATAPGAVLDVAKRALRAAAGLGEVRLRVAIADVEAVRSGEGALRPLLERGSLSLVEDPGLQQGEIIVEAAAGRVDARIGAQLEAFRRALEAGA